MKKTWLISLLLAALAFAAPARAQQQVIILNGGNNNPADDSIHTGFLKTNANFTYLFTPATLTPLVSIFTSGAAGDVPASGGGTTNFLRADGTWAAPGASGWNAGAVSALGTGISLSGGTLSATGAVTIGAPLSGCSTGGGNLYNSGSAVGCSANTDGGGGTISGASAARPGISITGTLNTTGNVDGAALFANLTNLASGSGTLLVDLQIGGISELKADTSGNLTTNGTITVGGGAGAQISGNGFRLSNQNGGFTNSCFSSGADLGCNHGQVSVESGSPSTRPALGISQDGTTYISYWGNLYTVSTLPTGTTGAHAFVTDATACSAFGGSLTGGGSVKCPAFYNGTTWVQG